MPSPNTEIDEVRQDVKRLREDLTTLGRAVEQRGSQRARAEYDGIERRLGDRPLVSAFTAFSIGFLTGRFF